MTILQRSSTQCSISPEIVRSEAQKSGLRNSTAFIRSLAHRIIVDEGGQDLIEYALIAALLAIGAVASLRLLQGYISQAFDTIGSNLQSAVG